MAARPVRTALGAVALLGAAGAARTVLARHAALRPVAPDLRHPLLYVPLTLSAPLLRLIRGARARPGPLAEGTTMREHAVPARDGGPPVTVQVHDTPGRLRPSGALVWIHGGGFVMGDPGADNALCGRIARDLDILFDARSAVARRFRGRALEALAQHVGRAPARP